MTHEPADEALAALRAHVQWRIELEGSFRITAAPVLLVAS
jgi:hypothetical protein